MGLTKSDPILESVRFVKPATFEWRDTSQSVHRYALLRVDMKVNKLLSQCMEYDVMI